MYVVVNDGDVGEPDQPLGVLVELFPVDAVDDPAPIRSRRGRRPPAFLLRARCGSPARSSSVPANCRSSPGHRFLPACTFSPQDSGMLMAGRISPVCSLFGPSRRWRTVSFLKEGSGHSCIFAARNSGEFGGIIGFAESRKVKEGEGRGARTRVGSCRRDRDRGTRDE